jgi:hypothetical protein
LIGGLGFFFRLTPAAAQYLRDLKDFFGVQFQLREDKGAGCGGSSATSNALQVSGDGGDDTESGDEDSDDSGAESDGSSDSDGCDGSGNNKTLQTPYQFSLAPYGRTLKKPKTHRVRGFLKQREERQSR